MFGLPFDPNDPNVPEHIREAFAEHQRQHDLENMSRQDSIHLKQEFIESLDEWQLKELRSLVFWVSENEQANGYIQGLCTWRLRQTFGHCICGEKHEPEPVPSDRPEGYENDPTPAEEAAHIADLMEEYRVRYVDPATDPDRVVCLDCGLEYPNLDDRMLRKPGKGGCQGCVQTTKWG